MPSEKTVAIVLKIIDFSETSSIVTLFSRDFGKIGALAKGARRPKGPFESALDLLAVCRIVFIRKSSDALDLLTEAKLERRFRAASRDLSRLYAGYYIIELLDLFTELGQPQPELFTEALWALERLDGNGPVEGTILRFELALLTWLGHIPTWQRCAQCGCQVDMQAWVPFGLLAGGVLCEPCRRGQRHVVRLSEEALKILQEFTDLDSSRVPGLEAGTKTYGEIRGVVGQYISHLLGRRPRMHRFMMLRG